MYLATFRLRNADGGRCWLQVQRARTGCDRRAALVKIGYDITEQRDQTAEYVYLQKLQSLSRITGVIAHDINNLLTGIVAIAALDMQLLSPAHELYNDLVSISQAASRAATLLGHLRTSKPLDFAPRTFDLNAQVHEFTHFIERVLGPDIAVSVALSPNLEPICGDPAQLKQVLLNLAMNARDAMPAGGELLIALGAAGDEAGAVVRLSVSDTGAGMDAATLARALEPGFTTRAHGSGLGLAICAEIVHQHGGRLQLASTPGQGTIVTVELPCVSDAAAD